jgi:hypothetical protein
MNRPLSLGLAALCLGIFALGCSSAPRTLEGTWVQDGDLPQTMTIQGDSYRNVANAMGNTITLTGKVAYDDQSQTAKITEMTMAAPGLPENLIAQAQGSMPKELEVSISWKNDNEIVVTPKGQTNPAAAGGSYKRQTK